MNRNDLGGLLARGEQYLKEHGIASSRLDAQVLMMEAAGLTKTQVLTRTELMIHEATEENYLQMIEKRARNMPVAMIINRCEFMSLDFFINENVLIPRPDTEVLVEEAIRRIREKKMAQMIDIGTGSGCIAVSLAKYCPELTVTAVDISAEALCTARKNAAAHGVSDRILFIESDLFTNIRNLEGQMDAIVSNPPYIPTADISSLMSDVRNYEPHKALDGGENGLLFYEQIADEGRAFLREGGELLLEIGWNQGQDVQNILSRHGFGQIKSIKDYAGHDRVVTGTMEKTTKG